MSKPQRNPPALGVSGPVGVDLPTAETPELSVPVGTMWFSALVRTKTGYAVAEVEVPADLWPKLMKLEGLKKSISASQTYPEHVAGHHKALIQRLAQRTQFQRLGSK